MAKDINLRAIISAVDKVSPTLATIKRNTSLLTKSAGGVGKSFADLGSRLAIPAGIFSAASIAGVVGAVKHFADVSGAVQDATVKLGISGEKLTAWQYAAEQAGVDNEKFRDSLAKLGRNLGDVSAGGGKAFAETLKAAGVSVKDANGKVKSSAQIFPELVGAFSKLTSSSAKARFATQAFGKSGQDLIPLLAGGSKGLADMENEANKLGITLNDKQLSVADDLGDSLNTLSKTFGGLSNTLAIALAPTVIKLVNSFKEWYMANQDLIKQKIERLAAAISRALENIDFTAILNGIGSTIKAINSVVQFFGGWKYAIIGLGLAINGGLIASLFKAGFALISFARAIATVGTLIAANPIGLLITALAGLAYAGYKIYENWDKIKAYFIELWADLKDIFNSAVAYISNLLSNFNPLNAISSVASGIKNLFSGAPSDINSTNNINQNSKASVGGAIEVKFENAPAGTRVSAQSNSDVSLNTNVGYTYGGVR